MKNSIPFALVVCLLPYFGGVLVGVGQKLYTSTIYPISLFNGSADGLALEDVHVILVTDISSNKSNIILVYN